jgi:ankyrin repeat protein
MRETSKSFEYDESRHYMDTALHCVVDANSLESVQALLERGIDVTLQDEKGRTARELAQHLGRGEAVAMLDG